jgi:hypothetical protein
VTRILGSVLEHLVKVLGRSPSLTRVSNSDYEQFLQDIIDQFNRLEAPLLETRIPHEELAACYGGSQSNVDSLVLQVGESAHPDQFVQVVPYDWSV